LTLGIGFFGVGNSNSNPISINYRVGNQSPTRTCWSPVFQTSAGTMAPFQQPGSCPYMTDLLWKWWGVNTASGSGAYNGVGAIPWNPAGANLSIVGASAIANSQQVVQTIALSNTTSEDTNRRHLHISVGLNDNLFFFTFELNRKYNAQNIYVYSYGDWFSQVLTSSSSFSTTFVEEAFTNAEQIHFNLEGIRGDLTSFYQNLGNNGVVEGTSNFTATEMYIIKHKGYCRKTTFWQNGSYFPVPDPLAWMTICGS
jgi:hypothetical protein